MTTTQTRTATPHFSGSTLLSTQQQPPPTQCFRVGTDGPIVKIEAEWDQQLQQYCFHVDQLHNHLRVQIDHIERAETGVRVNQLRYNDAICEPYRYPVSTGILEVYTHAESPLPRPTNDAYESSKVIKQFDQFHDLIHAASCAGQQPAAAEVAEHRRGLEQQYPALVYYQNDTGNITANKTLQLLLYPVPRRFFVVLPKRSRWFRNPLFQPLQLHLLCECGVYDDEMDSVLEDRTKPFEDDFYFRPTDGDDPLGPTRTHLSYHAGYIIKEPTAFCRDLGSHLLPVLKFLHYSAIFAGIVIPALASVNVTGWFTVAQSFVNYNNTSWSEPWLKTLDHVARLCKLPVHLKEDEIDLTKDDIPKAIDYPEYRQYKLHMQELDPDTFYGNLIPTFCNRTGRLKYVCTTHDDDPTRAEEQSFHHLQTLGNAVVLNRAKGEVTFKMDSKATTECFYLYLQATPSIRKVNIEIGPNTTAGEFKTLRKRLTEANVDNICLTATGVASPGSCYSEVLKVNHRCQSLALRGFEKFYSHISSTNMTATTRLKSLTVRCGFHDGQWRSLEMILKLCPALRSLTIATDYSNQLCSNIRSSLPQLKRLDFLGSTHTAIIRTTKGLHGQIVYTTELDIKAPCALESLPKEVYTRLVLLRLDWPSDPKGPLEVWFARTLQDCPRLLTFDLQVPLKHFLDWSTFFKDQFEAVNTLHGKPGRRRIVRLRSLKEEHEVTMTIRFLGHDPEFDIKVEMTGTKDSNPPLEAIFHSYGSSVRSLVASPHFDDTLAMAMTESFRDQRPRLELLEIDPSGLTDSRHLQRIVDQSPDLNNFTLAFSALEEPSQQDLVKANLDRYASQVTGLLLRSDGHFSSSVTNAIPPRSQLTKIRHFEVSFDEDRGRIHSEPELRNVLQFISPLALAMRDDSTPLRPLQSITLSKCDLTSAQWYQFIFALDLDALRHLSVEDTNFGAQEMDWLIERLPKPTAILMQDWLPPPLDELVIKNTALVGNLQRLAQLETKLLLRAPSIKVVVD
ncbi:hypothetical protein BGZ70_009975 [Mortierella alpina]|uniref:Uncharacterized protein n=1 Tax=Mortierella alpina TaxID=64518 RepID=A0A9P6J0T9_MORAP|nr:hypothetical protein BGZ70_009975 [Mortierella alpina]